MMGYTMRYQQELRKPQEYFHDIKKAHIDEESLDLAETLIKKRTAAFDPSKFTDSYETALKELVEAKLKNLPVPKEEPAPHRAKVINLMDALRKSVQGTETAAGSGKKKPPARETAAHAGAHEKAGPTLVKLKAAKGSKRKSA